MMILLFECRIVDADRHMLVIRDQWFSAYAKFSEKLTFLSEYCMKTCRVELLIKPSKRKRLLH